MSQPEPDFDKQKRRHAGPLIGITAVLVFVAVILTWMFGWTATEGQPPAGAETQIDSRTGAEEPAASGATGAPTTTPEAEVTPPGTPDAETTTAPTSPQDDAAPPAGSTSP